MWVAMAMRRLWPIIQRLFIMLSLWFIIVSQCITVQRRAIMAMRQQSCHLATTIMAAINIVVTIGVIEAEIMAGIEVTVAVMAAGIVAAVVIAMTTSFPVLAAQQL
jgi:hypothetical protein